VRFSRPALLHRIGKFDRAEQGSLLLFLLVQGETVGANQELVISSAAVFPIVLPWLVADGASMEVAHTINFSSFALAHIPWQLEQCTLETADDTREK
jgi:hypothetical protein